MMIRLPCFPENLRNAENIENDAETQKGLFDDEMEKNESSKSEICITLL